MDSQNECEAFSLIEVLLATGLVTFVLLLVFSLMPVGLSSLKEANRELVNSEIFGGIEAELAFTPFDAIEDYQGQRFPMFFSNEGIEVESRAEAQHIVRCDPATTDLNGELKRVTVRIGYNADPADSSPGNVSKRTFVVADLGQ